MEKVKVTFDDKTWQESIAEFEADHAKEFKARHKQLEVVERTMSNLLASLDTLDNPTLIAKVQDRYNAAEQDCKRLQGVIAETNQEIAYIETVRKLRKTYSVALDGWNEMTRDEKRAVLHAFITRIVISPLDNHGLHIVVEWRDETTDEIRLAKKGTTFSEWLTTEKKALLKLFKDGATQLELASRFPNRTWHQIYMKIYTDLGIGYTPSETPIRKKENYSDYLKRVGSNTLYKATAGKRWNDEDTNKLKVLIESNATQLEIAQAFAHRKWMAIRKKIRQVLGNGIEIPESGYVRKNETYYEYELRLQRDIVTDESKNAEETIEGEQYVSRTVVPELVQKEQSKMRQTDRTGAWDCAASDQTSLTYCMVWCLKRSGANQTFATERIRYRVNARDFDGFFDCERWQDSGHGSR